MLRDVTSVGGSCCGADGAWSFADYPLPQVDDSAVCTVVQVRLVGQPPARLRMHQSHTIADLKKLVEQQLMQAGEQPRPFVLSSGFPPKPLTDDGATLASANLLNAVVIQRWC